MIATAIEPSSDLLVACRAEYPGLDLAASAFLAFATERVPAGTTLTDGCAADLYLAFGCLQGNPDALRAFDSRYGADLDRVLSGLGRRGLDDDAKQILKLRLFVGPTAKIATYTGRGPLRRWLRVAATRLALEVTRTKEQPADDWAIAALPDGSDDPELAYFKAHYKAALKTAFTDALAKLTERQRTLLAQYHVDELTIDQLGALYGVHRVTAARWVARAQIQLRTTMLDLVQERIGISPEDLRAVTRLVRSQLTISLRALRPVKKRRR
jgi:RNA polymerase sigma-70 factor (ECF subfamily)